MENGEVERLRTALQVVPVAAVLTSLPDRRFLAVNERAADLFGVDSARLIGADVVSTVVPDERDALARAYDAIATGAVDGYQVRRHVARPDGSTVAVVVWGRRVDEAGGPFGLWILTPESQARAFDALAIRPADVVLALTNHDWELEYVSADTKLLGLPADQLRGAPLLGFVHPSVAAEFLEAAARAVTGHMAVTVATRLRAGPNLWADRYVLLVPMCDHDPPRLGVVITAGPTGDGSATGTDIIEPHVRHSAVEARARNALRALPSLTGNPAAADLSPRQVEIVARLIDGENVDEVARNLYLSPSTVRNHLTAIYRKFGVHSQAELLAALLRASTRDL